MQSLKKEVKSLRGELEEAKKNNGAGLEGIEEARKQENKRKER